MFYSQINVKNTHFYFFLKNILTNVVGYDIFIVVATSVITLKKEK